MIGVVLAILGAGSAVAAEGPSLWVREFAAVAAQPTGVMAEVTAEARAPVLRYGGVAFNSTFIGAGVRVAVTPVHVDTALRVSLQPIDLLPITVEAFRSTYWASPWGMTPADRVAGQRMADRAPYFEADRDFAAAALGVTVSPTLQLRLGPIAAFSNVAVTFLSIHPTPAPEPWVFDPFRGMVLAPEDRVLDHTSAVLWERSAGDGEPIFRVGPTLRGRASHVTGDVSLTLGGVLQWRPGREPHDPTLLLLVAPYLRDPDFLGPMPMVAAVITVERDLLFGRKE